MVPEHSLWKKKRKIDTAINMGYDILMASNNPDLFKDFDLKWNIKIELGNYDKAEYEILAFLKHEKINISGVVCWSDREVELVARLGTQLNIPSSSISAAIAVRDKSETRIHVQNVAPHLNPRFKIIETKEDFSQAIKEVKVPCIIKPCGNSGGRGIFKIRSNSDIMAVYEKYKTYNASQKGDMYGYYSEKMLVEELIEGTEHSLAGIIIDGVPQFFAISDKRIDSNISFQYQNSVPSEINQTIQDQLKKDCEQLLNSIGLNHCGFHIDFMLSQEGPKILEIGGRLGGECINSHLIPYVFNGFRPYELLLNSIQGIKTNIVQGKPTCKAGIRSIYSAEKGIIGKIEGLDDLRADSRVKDIVQLRFEGDPIDSPAELYNSCRVISFTTICSENEDINAVMDELAEKVCIKVETLKPVNVY